jgi:outer membrane protein OmpA-like peptidoglycan-associated protein
MREHGMPSRPARPVTSHARRRVGVARVRPIAARRRPPGPVCPLRAGTRGGALLAPLAARHRAALALVPLLAAVLGLPRAATGAAPAAPAPREDLLTLANGAIVARAAVNSAAALELLNGNRKDHGWNNQRPKDRPPYALVFELLAPTVLREVGVATAGARTAGGTGVDAKVVDVAASATGPDADFAALGTLTVAAGDEAALAVADAAPVRWLRFTVRENHGNPSWTYLAEVFAYGEQTPVSDDDGRYTGAWESNFGPIEMVQTGTQVAGCYRGGTLLGSVSGGVARVAWQDRQNPKVHGTALFVVDARKHLAGVQYRLPSRARWGGPPAGAKTPKTDCSRTPPPANPVAAALDARGEVELYGIHFDFDSAALQPRSEPVLRQLADALRAGAPFTAAVIGHTDAVGDDAYNLDLSRRRAESVAAWLADHGVERARLDPDGRGEREPVADDATADGRALNRRVTVVKRPNP